MVCFSAPASCVGYIAHGPASMQVLCIDARWAPCTECGRRASNFCNGDELRVEAPCYAGLRILSEQWPWGQRIPLRSDCEERKEWCRFCRKEDDCTPQEWR